jgi:Tol biopolymer transport system component
VRRKSKASSATKAASTGTTRARRTMFGLACLCVLGLVAFLGSSAPTVGAAESFPGQGFLPGNRAWEMVSPPDKHGGGVARTTPRIHAAAAGDAAAFTSAIGFGDVQGTDTSVEYISQRDGRPGTNGWSTHAITPRLPSLTFFVVGADDLSTYRGDFSADLSHAVFRSARPLTDAPKVTDVANLYRRDDMRSPGPGNYELLTDAAAPLGFEGFPVVFLAGATRPWLVGASSDFSHVAFESPLGLTAGTSSSLSSEFKLFENDEGSVRLVGRVPKEPDETFCDDAGGPSVECVSAPTSQAGISASGAQYSARMVSADGSRILFQTPTGFSGGNIYLREDGTRTFQLNASEKEPPEPPAGDARIGDASRDGSRIFFTTAQSLVEADEDAFPDLYMYEVEKPEGERLTLIGNNGDSVIGASDDGHYVYFFAGADSGIYLWHDGDISFIGSILDGLDANLNSSLTGGLNTATTKRSRVSPDGRHLLFMSKFDKGLKGHGGFAGYDHAHNEEFYVYDADSDRLRCVSCNPSGAPATKEARLDMVIYDGFVQSSSHLSHALSDDGRYAFFSSEERLVPSDTNGVSDAYLYDTEAEEVRLLSSGEDPSPSYFADASADGKNAFILTSQQLSRWDNDTSYDLYDARVDGGLPEPLPPPPSCQGDACQPTPTQLNDPTPASSSFKGAGNPTSARCPQGKRKVKARNGKSRCVKRHTAKQHKRAAKHNRRAGR